MADGMADRKMAAVKLVQEYRGEGSVSEWLEKVRSVCELNQISEDSDILYVIALRLAGSAYVVYQQLEKNKKKSLKEVEHALRTAYEVEPYVAWCQLMERKIEVGESVDEFLAALRKLGRLIGGLSNAALLYAFVRGLPEKVRTAVRASVQLHRASVEETLVRARALMAESVGPLCAAVDVAPTCVDEAPTCVAVTASGVPRAPGERRRPRCFHCKGEGHMKPRCPLIECFGCHEKGHMANKCPKNGVRK